MFTKRLGIGNYRPGRNPNLEFCTMGKYTKIAKYFGHTNFQIVMFQIL